MSRHFRDECVDLRAVKGFYDPMNLQKKRS
jgi:hypothetical protein